VNIDAIAVVWRTSNSRALRTIISPCLWADFTGTLAMPGGAARFIPTVPG